MKLKAILFDLDGTLLPMDQDAFTHAYFKLLAARLAPHGYDPKALVDGIWTGTAAMVKNDGSCTNEQAFWKRFAKIFGDHVYQDEPIFADFYETEFQQVQKCCGFNPNAGSIVDTLKSKGYRLILATNPLFPETATRSRIRWAGLDVNDFELFTTYENSRYCKPNLQYYIEILNRIGCKAEECMMIGNDVQEDMLAGQLGMQVFLLTDCLLNRTGADISVYPRGGFNELRQYIEKLP